MQFDKEILDFISSIGLEEKIAKKLINAIAHIYGKRGKIQIAPDIICQRLNIDITTDYSDIAYKKKKEQTEKFIRGHIKPETKLKILVLIHKERK